MATRLPKRGKNRIPKRGRAATKQAQTEKSAARRFKFTKKQVQAIEAPARGQRLVFRDTQTPHLCLRVTPTAKTFYWEKTVNGSQKRVTIGRFPEINVEQARA